MRTVKIEEREKIDRIIRSCKSCYVAMSDQDQPYVLPMNFALDGDTVILHSAQSGRMWETLKRNPRVCINWTSGEELAWQDVGVGCSYRVVSSSVLAEGEAVIVEAYDQKVECMERLMAQYSDRTFRFSEPSILNVGVIRVRVHHFSARKFGAKAVTPWSKPEDDYSTGV
jgi:nitroimidazol reductase NimA-like FMN-containing flavoprotein (pyridoxamine 5'-phosphate oxidase superfamily)